MSAEQKKIMTKAAKKAAKKAEKKAARTARKIIRNKKKNFMKATKIRNMDKYSNADEVFDMKALNNILDNPKKHVKIITSMRCGNVYDFINKVDKKSNVDNYMHALLKYRDLSNNGVYSVSYEKNKCDQRIYSTTSMSMQNMNLYIKGIITGNLYTEIDVANAHPVFMLYLVKYFNIPLEVPYLEKYVYNRDEAVDIVKKEANCDYISCKMDILKLINGYSYMRLGTRFSSFMYNINEEILNINVEMGLLFPKRKQIIIDSFKGKKVKPHRIINGKVVRYYINRIESKIADMMLREFKTNKYILSFDGISVLKSQFTDQQVEKKVKKITKKVYKKIPGLSIKINID